MQLTGAELNKIVAEVEQEFQTLLKSEADGLKKAKDDDSAPDEGSDSAPAADASASSEGSAPAESPAEGSAPAEASAPAPAEGSAPPADASAAPAPDAAPADPAADASAPADPEALKAEYSKLDPESLKAHYVAAKAALFEMMGAAGGAPGADASAPAGAPPAAAPAPEASAPAAGSPPPAFKSELKDVPANGGLKEQAPAVPDAIKKSLDEKDAKVADLEKQVELLAKAMEISLGTPVRKAITSVAHLPKTEETAPTKELSKDEVKTKIRKAIESGKLNKSQKDSLFSYTLGNVEFDKIKDLLDVK